MKIIRNMVQGDQGWHQLRSQRFTASEAAAACGDHKYMARNDLLKQKATGVVPEVDAHQQRIFDQGHKFEDMARSIAEEIMQEELFPCTCEDDTGTYLASMDGLDMMGLNGWEHKTTNEKLRTATAETLEEHYKWQMDHQMMVTGAESILFMASNGTKEDCNWFWYERDEKRIEKLVSAWQQFATDLANYQPPAESAPAAVGKTPENLPALRIEVTGMVKASNLQEFKDHALAVLSGINRDLQTDQDFATAESTVKWCKGVEDRLSAAKDQALSQTADIYEVLQTLDYVSEEARKIRLTLDKDVKAQKQQRKDEILRTARGAYSKFYVDLESALESESGGTPIVLKNDSGPDFAGAMKGKRTIDSLQSACDDTLAAAKIELNGIAELIRANLRELNKSAGDYGFLFRDFGHICQKPAEDFAALVKVRIAEHKEEEEAKASQSAKATPQPERQAKPAPQSKPAEKSSQAAHQPQTFWQSIDAWQAKHAISAQAVDELAVILEGFDLNAAA